MAAIIATVLLVALTTVALLTGRGGDASLTQSSNPKTGACRAAIGELEEAIAGEPDAMATSRALLAAGRETGGGCAAASGYRWGGLIVQELLTNDGTPNGALVVTPAGKGMWLNRGAFGSYHQIGGKDGGAAQASAGYPVTTNHLPDGHVEIELSTGGLLVAEEVPGPYFWMPAQFRNWWRSHSELGLPASNPMASLRMDFQHGYAAIAPDRPEPHIVIVEDPAANLPDGLAHRILRQAEGTAWWITDGGRREWIPDGGTWICLGGDSKLLRPDLEGFAVASMPYGGVAVCPSK